MQTCPTYNRGCSNEWYLDRFQDVKDYAPDHDVTDLRAARDIVNIDMNEKIIGGLRYHKSRANYYEQMPMRKGMLTMLKDEVKKVDISDELAIL